MAHPNEELIHRFYTAFSKGDAQTMGDCYADDVEFRDPAFGVLHGDEARLMWKMLTERAKGRLNITFGDLHADEHKGRAHWEAIYPFSKTGRTVHNKIDAVFDFKNGKIVRHHDSFNFWKWASMALGPVGMLLGFTPMLHNKVQKEARAQLEQYRKSAQKS